MTQLTIIDRLPLNLTAATRWGIRRSSLTRRRRKGEPAVTEEERLVRYADDIAWVNHDIDDAIMTGILSQSDLGVALLRQVGTDRRERLTHMMERLVERSRSRLDKGLSVDIPSDLEAHLAELRVILEAKVWRHPTVARRTEAAKQCVVALFEHFKAHPEDLPAPTQDRLERGDLLDDVLRDHISGMTDRYALRKYREFHGPETPLARPEAVRPPEFPCEGYRRVVKGPGEKEGDEVILDFGGRHGAEVDAVYRVCFYYPRGKHPSRCKIDDIVGWVQIVQVEPNSCRAKVLKVMDADRPVDQGCVVIRDPLPS